MLKESTPWEFFEHISLSFLAASFLQFVRSHHKSVGSCPSHSQITLLHIKQIEPWGAELESRIFVHPGIPPSKQQATQYINRSHYKKLFFLKKQKRCFLMTIPSKCTSTHHYMPTRHMLSNHWNWSCALISGRK